jgi:outer membrane autotransporter protein
MDGFGHWARQDAQGGLAGYDYRLAGAALGADRLMADDLLVGVSYGQSNADIDMDDRMAKGDIDSYFGSLYGSYFTDCMYVDATVSYGRQRYENTRRIEVGTVSGAAHSSHDGDVYSVHAETGWNLSLKPWTLQPFAALRYTFLDEDGYAESGAEGVNLRVKERKTDSLVSNLGLRFACPFEKDHWLCIPEVTVAWDHDFDLDDRRITAAFEGAPTTTFVTDGRDIDRDGLVLGAGLTVIRKNNLSLSLTYTGELRRHYTAHALAGGMRYEF